MAETIGMNPANSSATVVDAGANDTKGAAVSLGSASVDFAAIQIGWFPGTGVGARFLWDVLVNTTVVCGDLLTRPKTTFVGANGQILIPWSGKAGDEIKIQGQTDDTAARSYRFFATLLTAAEAKITADNVTSTYGVKPLTTQGTEIDPGPVANTLGAKAEITTAAGVNEDTDFLTLAVISAGTNVIAVNTSWILKLWADPTGSTATGIEVSFSTGSTPDQIQIWGYQFTTDRTKLIAGTRLWASCQSNVDADPNRKIEVSLIGHQRTAASGGGGRVTNNLLTGLDGNNG